MDVFEAELMVELWVLSDGRNGGGLSAMFSPRSHVQLDRYMPATNENWHLYRITLIENIKGLSPFYPFGSFTESIQRLSNALWRHWINKEISWDIESDNVALRGHFPDFVFSRGFPSIQERDVLWSENVSVPSVWLKPNLYWMYWHLFSDLCMYKNRN